MVASTTMSATCLSGILLGSFMCTLIVLCKKFNRDPGAYHFPFHHPIDLPDTSIHFSLVDNIAPAIASCLGDLVTLCLVGLVSTLLIPFLHTPLPFVISVIVVITASISLIYTLRNKYVRSLLGEGWTPLFGAMIISSGTGIVLDMFVSKYEGFPLLAVVISGTSTPVISILKIDQILFSGLPGAAGSIFVSRLSTSLHATVLSKPSLQSDNQPSGHLVMLTLLLITLPVEIAFLVVLRSIGWLQVPVIFIVFSMLFFCCAVSLPIVFMPLIIVECAIFLITGLHFTRYRTPTHQLAVVEKSGP